MDYQTLGFEIAKRFSEMGVLDERCMELAMKKAEEAVTQNFVTAINEVTVSNWVCGNYPQWFGAAPGTVAVTPAPVPKPDPSDAPTSNPAPSAKGEPKGKAAQDATGPANVPPANNASEPEKTEDAPQ